MLERIQSAAVISSPVQPIVALRSPQRRAARRRYLLKELGSKLAGFVKPLLVFESRNLPIGLKHPDAMPNPGYEP
jgi:hypothetical protein